MGKMRSGWDFLPEHGFKGSVAKGMTHVSGYSRKTAKFAKGGKVKGPTDAKTGESFPAARVPTPTVGAKGPDLNVKFPGNHLAFKKGGKVSGYREMPEKQNKELFAKGGKVHNDHDEDDERYAKGGPVHSHFMEGHKLHAHPNGIGVHHPMRGHTSGAHSKGGRSHIAPPHEKAGHKRFAGGGIARPTGMPRAPVIGMKRVRHAPGMIGAGGMGRPQPGIPGLSQPGTSSFGQQPMKPRGMGSGLGSVAGRGLTPMKKGGAC